MGSSTYPATLDTFNTALDGAKKLDDAAQLHSDIHEAIADALNKIEAELGVNPSQALATVAAFLAAIPIANLVGYPADATKVLAGDGTWIPPGEMASVADNSVTSAKIADGTIVNADISTTAAISPSKLGNYPADDTKMLRGDGAWVRADYTNIQDNTIVNANINASAAISASKLAPLDILDANIATYADIAGSKLAAGSVTSTQIADGTIGNGDISGSAAITSSKVTGLGFDSATDEDTLSAVLTNIGIRLAAHGI